MAAAATRAETRMTRRGSWRSAVPCTASAERAEDEADLHRARQRRRPARAEAAFGDDLGQDRRRDEPEAHREDRRQREEGDAPAPCPRPPQSSGSSRASRAAMPTPADLGMRQHRLDRVGRLVGAAAGVVGDRREAEDPHPGMHRRDHLDHRRHAHRVRPGRPQEAPLGRGLERRPGDAGVDAACAAARRPPRPPAAPRRAARGRRRATCRGSAGRARRRSARSAGSRR